MKTPKILIISTLITGIIATAQAAPLEPELHTVAKTNSAVWNAVAVDKKNVLYVSGPKWTGSMGPSVSKIDNDGIAHPYPNDEWNSADPALSASKRFINVNAMRTDGKGHLWIVDAGVTDFGGKVVPGGAKVVVVDLQKNKVTKIYTFNDSVAKPSSYIDDIRLNGRYAYLTDAGDPGIVILDLETGEARRVLENSPATHAPKDRDIILDGKVVYAPNGEPLRVNADPLEVSNDGKWFYFGSLEGPWHKIETRWLNDPTLSEKELAKKVEFWQDLPPVGGTVMDSKGNMYFSDLANNSLKRLTPNGKIETIITDSRLHWVDAPSFDEKGRIYLPAAQMDRVALFNKGTSEVVRPLQIYRIDLSQKDDK